MRTGPGRRSAIGNRRPGAMKYRKRTVRTCQTRRGCRARVLTWGSGVGGSGRLVVHPHASAGAWQGGVFLPLAAGLHELGEGATGPAVEHVHRALRGQLRLAPVVEALAHPFLEAVLALIEG